MTNDTNTLNGALMELGETMADNLVAKGVTASASDGLTTLAGKILDIQTGGSCYHIEFSEASYTAVGGSATLEIYLQENYAPKSSATVTVTGSDGSVYTGITNTNGLASVTVTNISADTTFTATYSNVTATCTVNVATYLFYDGGVTGNVNTDYTNVGNGIQIDVTSTGTKISCTAYGNRYRRPNVLLNGDFRVTVTCVETTDNGFEMALLNSSNTKQYHLTFSWANGKDWNNNDTQVVTNLSAVTDSPVVMERVGSTLTVKCNGTQLLTRTITTSDVYYAFGTHSQGRRYCIFKDLMIEAL